MNKFCKYCSNEIVVMCFRGTDWCSENCRKDLIAQRVVEKQEASLKSLVNEGIIPANTALSRLGYPQEEPNAD